MPILIMIHEGVFGYSEKFGNHPGGQAEYLRVPFGNYIPFKIPQECELEDESLLFLSDVLPTAYWSVENAGVKQGDTVIVLGVSEKLDPTRIITHTMPLDDAPKGYKMFNNKKDGCIKVVLKP